MAEGLLINCTHNVVLRALPPYISTEQDVDRAIRVLDKVLKKAKPRGIQDRQVGDLPHNLTMLAVRLGSCVALVLGRGKQLGRLGRRGHPGS